MTHNTLEKLCPIKCFLEEESAPPCELKILLLLEIAVIIINTADLGYIIKEGRDLHWLICPALTSLFFKAH